jgi:hypothetical protein
MVHFTNEYNILIFRAFQSRTNDRALTAAEAVGTGSRRAVAAAKVRRLWKFCMSDGYRGNQSFAELSTRASRACGESNCWNLSREPMEKAFFAAAGRFILNRIRPLQW